MSKADSSVVSAVPLDPHTWVERHGDYLYRFAVAHVRRTDAAEDLVQDALLAAWKAQDRFDGAASERTWLTAILKRKVIDWLRKQVRERLAADPGTGPDRFTDDLFTRRGEWRAPPGLWARGHPAEVLDREEFWDALHGCLGKLPVRLHDVFALRYLDEAASEDVCRELGLTPANFWVMLHRARLRMWWCLSKNWFGTEPQSGSES
ncbi:rna sigma-24 ecf subfamily : RNA polymerase, sigma-24 subunit, ECF subfamily OS=Methyloglobulus morosus KoM1 GN=MGMO_177c00220 PE=4 SV=1: Sigma70_r2: Sigma70_r4_2 [Gemmata massiliana]|uniref:RNA polymerase sigma factor n=1 Tax=Gemmata massiliana TaxID=1210884 RepID=A0A6P2D0F3_9BACT|nr:sigma-70 family RNA polymerase sigma factor [Gemmata massiliana]VTR92902.1 rna sigma-24 ecf subfamily : RNA polymerase, sigma-24 subunit, ECF subfamily OS=Methyloglobulus morosus KoM1 GN=MGMO_177c00220 PE=4 SV=1: Sigma70_r2: Sigma70_r4_2 [Gemmata massiliana]